MCLSEAVYMYVIQSIEQDDPGLFWQHGCAPNFQGGVITLCTCKHWMRTFKPVEDWKGVWIAGFSGLTHTDQQSLVYLMRIGESFSDFRTLWQESELLSHKAKAAKTADKNSCGDLYEPVAANKTNPLSPEAYNPPCESHVHYHSWEYDVDTSYYDKKNPSALLIGDPEKSYIWQEPALESKRKFTQGQATENLSDFLDLLTPGKRQ